MGIKELQRRKRNILDTIHQIELQDSIAAGRRWLEKVYQVELEELEEEIKKLSGK